MEQLECDVILGIHFFCVFKAHTHTFYHEQNHIGHQSKEDLVAVKLKTLKTVFDRKQRKFSITMGSLTCS